MTDEQCKQNMALAAQASAIHKDATGLYHQGKPITIANGCRVSISVLSVGRNRQRAELCAENAAKKLCVPKNHIYILLNFDFRHPAHYEPKMRDATAR